MALHRHVSGPRGQAYLGMRPQSQFQLPAEVGQVPRFDLGPRGLGPDIAYQVVHDELLLDGNARLNLATFVTTWMDHQADTLMLECVSKNLIDKDEYPQTAEIERRCVNIVAHLFNVPADGDGIGASTIGSSEAVMLAGPALKGKGARRAGAAGAAPRPAEPGPGPRRPGG